ncbi:hypothetical protein AAFF_G00157050 [Aldrovandia affinis]|uniref:Uncharacterized protein n=1 Tax=Aldrovandia affinis TaxID=143900 RepID=A0AAD7RNP4_9TELE|nr:hypothetical protein AAFF_G00157050 [Aldrovandia affinis]
MAEDQSSDTSWVIQRNPSYGVAIYKADHSDREVVRECDVPLQAEERRRSVTQARASDISKRRGVAQQRYKFV